MPLLKTIVQNISEFSSTIIATINYIFSDSRNGLKNRHGNIPLIIAYCNICLIDYASYRTI